MEPCFGRRARRAAHVSDPRRWKEVNPKGVTAAARRCRASLLTRVRRAAEAALPDARNDLCDELGQNPRSSGRSGTAEIKTRLNLLQLVERSQVVAGYRADVQTGAETLLYVQLDAPIWSPAV